MCIKVEDNLEPVKIVVIGEAVSIPQGNGSWEKLLEWILNLSREYEGNEGRSVECSSHGRA